MFADLIFYTFEKSVSPEKKSLTLNFCYKAPWGSVAITKAMFLILTLGWNYELLH